MGKRNTQVIRDILAVIAAVVLSGLLFGCAVNIGNQEFRVRMGTRAPQHTIENGDGQKVVLEALDPPGNSLFLFLRGQL